MTQRVYPAAYLEITILFPKYYLWSIVLIIHDVDVKVIKGFSFVMILSLPGRAGAGADSSEHHPWPDCPLTYHRSPMFRWVTNQKTIFLRIDQSEASMYLYNSDKKIEQNKRVTEILKNHLQKLWLIFYHRLVIDIILGKKYFICLLFSRRLRIMARRVFKIHVMKRTKRQKVTSLQTKVGLIWLAFKFWETVGLRIGTCFILK